MKKIFQYIMLRREKRSQEQYLAGNLRIGPVRAPQQRLQQADVP